MKQLWHSRSVAVAKYPSNILKQLNEYDQKKIEEECIMMIGFIVMKMVKC